MNDSTDFDGVVFGESPAGLWLAKQLLAKGQKILVIATGTSGTQNALPRFAVEDLGLERFVKANRETNPIQILTPTRRVRLFQDDARLKAELEFQFGLPFSLGAAPNTSLLRGLAYWVRGNETAPVLQEEWQSLYARWFDTVYFDEPAGFLSQMLLGELEKSGATIVKPGSLRRIFIDRKAFVGVQLANTSKMISVQRAFLNTNLDFLNRFFNEPMSVRSSPLAWKFEMSFECDPASLPVGITDRMLYVEEGAPVLEIFQEKPGRFRLKTTLPLQDYSLDRGEQRRLAARMLKVCEGIFPDLEYNLRKVSPDLRDPDRAMGIDLPKLYPFQDLKSVPPQLLSYGVGGPTISPNPLPGVWITNEEVYPREDAMGGFEAAKAALKAIEAANIPK
jgi:hypothetical protein